MEQFDRIVDRLYDGVTDSAAWPEALTRLCDAVGAHHAIVMAGRRDRPADGMCVSSRVAPDHLDNFVQAAAAGPVDWLQALPAGTAFDFQAVIPRKEFVRTDFFNQAIRPMHGYRAVFAIPLRGDGAESFLALCRPEQAEDFTGAQTALVNRVVPHLARALRSRLRLDQAARSASAATAVMDELETAVAVVDAKLCPIVMNRAFQALVEQADPLRMRRGCLAMDSRDGETRLRLALRRALSDDPRAPGQHAIPLPRRTFGPPRLLLVRRLQSAGVTIPRAILILEDPARHPAHLEALAASLFELTPREAELAARVANGADLESVAAGMGVSLGTARNYLKAVFVKTHTRRQAELVALLARVGRLSR